MFRTRQTSSRKVPAKRSLKKISFRQDSRSTVSKGFEKNCEGVCLQFRTPLHPQVPPILSPEVGSNTPFSLPFHRPLQ